MGVASTTAIFDTFLGNANSIIVYTLGGVLLTGVALLGLGFAWRHLKKIVTGRKI